MSYAATTWDARFGVVYQDMAPAADGRGYVVVQMRPWMDSPLGPAFRGNGPYTCSTDCGCMNCREFLKGER